VVYFKIVLLPQYRPVFTGIEGNHDFGKAVNSNGWFHNIFSFRPTFTHNSVMV
jgi:hypothetical protein